MERTDIKTNGMHCHSCEMLIEMSLGELAGVASVKADNAGSNVSVEYDPSVISRPELVAAITAAGYEAEE